MIRGFVTAAVVGLVRRKAGVPAIGTIPAALLTSGASLILTKGRRPVGVAVAALGGLLLWREVVREREEAEVPEQC
jgi:uncharacterized membrane protein (UPF0136 family)